MPSLFSENSSLLLATPIEVVLLACACVLCLGGFLLETTLIKPVTQPASQPTRQGKVGAEWVPATLSSHTQRAFSRS
jgi:hypothetical protein